MIMLALFAAAVVAAQPIDGLAGLITADDYPDAARRAGQEGNATATLLIDTSGYVADCSIKTSSGSADLDAATCAILRERARYAPARDKAGRAIPWTTNQTVRWALEKNELASQGYRMTFAVDAAGQLGNCKLDEFGAHDPAMACNADMAKVMAGAYLQKPLTGYSDLSVMLAIEVDNDKPAARPPGQETKIIARASIGVAPDGVITSCTMTESAPFQGRSMNLCDGQVPVGKKEFTPDAEGRARTMTVSLELAATPR